MIPNNSLNSQPLINQHQNIKNIYHCLCFYEILSLFAEAFRFAQIYLHSYLFPRFLPTPSPVGMSLNTVSDDRFSKILDETLFDLFLVECSARVA